MIGIIDDNNVIAKTKSVCPVCLESIDACVNERKDKVFLSKECPRHGTFEILLSNHAWYYKDLRKYFFATIRKRPQDRYLLYLTPQCNMHCPICVLLSNKSNVGSLSAEDVALLIKRRKNARFTIFGAEPTCSTDLMTIIKMLKRSQKIVYLYTNGIKLADTSYLANMQKSGVSKIYLQFDGFNEQAYTLFRGTKQLRSKLDILDKLKNIDVPVVLNATIARGVNEPQMFDIFKYALDNRFVKTVNFMTYEVSGKASTYFTNGFIMPDELVDVFESQCGGKITRRGIFLFQKLLYAYLSFLNKSTCLYIQYFWVIRHKESYYPISDILNLDCIEGNLDRYRKLFVNNRAVSKIYFMFMIIKLLCNVRVTKFLKELFSMVMSFTFSHGEYTKKGNNFLQIIFSTGCDPYKIDYQIVKNCQNGLIYKDLSGKVNIVESDAIYLLQRARKELAVH